MTVSILKILFDFFGSILLILQDLNSYKAIAMGTQIRLVP